MYRPIGYCSGLKRGDPVSPVVEKKLKPDRRSRKKSYAFYLSQGLVDDVARVSKETGRSKSEVLELIARAGFSLHEKGRGHS
ncbi:MAG: hypothetical protein V2A66_03320 [Pseudomonadota bacterium]